MTRQRGNQVACPAGEKHANGDTIPDRWRPRFWEDADTRRAVIRGIIERVEKLKREAGCDSYQKEILAERAIFIVTVLETAEVNALEGVKPLDVGSYVQSVNSLQGLLRQLGLDRKAKKVGLREYLNKDGEGGEP